MGKQIFIEKRDHIDVKAVIYEMGVGGVSAAIGGVGGAVTKLTTPKEIINGTLKTAGKEALGGFVEDVCFQMFVEGKSVTEIDWGQSLTTSSISGLAGATSFLASQGRMHLDPPSKIKVSEAAALIDNVADVPSHPKANILPEASTKPNRRAVKNAAGGLADAGSAAGSAGRKSKTAVSSPKIKSASVNKNSSGLSKNQQQIQDQTISSALSSSTVRNAEQSVLPSSVSTNTIDPRYLKSGYQPGSRGEKLRLDDYTTNRTKYVSEWRRYIDQQDIPQERRLFLGDNYVKVDDGKWRSLDGKRQFRAKQNDYLGRHGMGLPKVLHQRHVHFEFVQLNNSKTGYKVIKNIHVPIK